MNPNFPLQAMVFDFDGTLAELTIDFAFMKRKIAAVAGALLERDIAPGETPVLEWIDELAGQAGDRDLALELGSRARLIITAMEIDAASQGRLFPETRGVLDHLAGLGIRLGVVTRNCTPAVLKVFPDLRRYCQVFLPREDARVLKPHPGHLLQALEVLGVEPARSLMAGDHPMDVVTARDAGAVSAALLTGHSDREAFNGSSPDIVAADLPSLVERLDVLGMLPPTKDVAWA